MDLSDSTKVVYSRIEKVDPENVSKIIGYLLLKDHDERDMIRLAFSPDRVIHSLINEAKSQLAISKPAVSVLVPVSVSPPITPSPVSPLQFSPFSPGGGGPDWDPQLAATKVNNNVDFLQPGYFDSDICLRSQMQYLTLEDQLESLYSMNSDFSSSYFNPEPALGTRTSRRSPSLPEFPVKVCHYFNKGFCKHGNNCRFFHGHSIPQSFSQILNPNPYANMNEIGNEEHVFSPGSLEKLELEIVELLKMRRGFPISIASLPMLYSEKYGKNLQAEGYLTESQRHGKAGYSLTKLLARLTNSIRLIDRPHGQHSVILAEDLPKYFEYTGERNDPGGIVAGSRQIYLTFPAESPFSEQDVANYFSKFGPVQDVRIPCQQKRMFGFVTFVFPETVKQILAKGNPHFVCGARVLVKPYREKAKLVDSRYNEKLQQPMFYSPHFLDGDSKLHSMPSPRMCDNSRLPRKQLMEEHSQVLERRRFSEMQLAPFKPSTRHHPFFGYSRDDLKLEEACVEQAELVAMERYNFLLDVLNNGSTIEDNNVRRLSANFSNNQDSSQVLNLPESPFASPIRGNGISTVI